MGSPAKDHALLLAAPNPTEAEMARELLSSNGIPSLFHGQDRDFAELGGAIHYGIARPDLYVPKQALERARALLRETWDASALTDDIALATPAPVEPEARASSVLLRILVFALLAAAAASFLVRDFF